MHIEKVFGDNLNCWDIYLTHTIFQMTNLLNNSMVLGMRNVLLLKVYTFHAMILFIFWNGKYNKDSNC